MDPTSRIGKLLQSQRTDTPLTIDPTSPTGSASGSSSASESPFGSPRDNLKDIIPKNKKETDKFPEQAKQATLREKKSRPTLQRRKHHTGLKFKPKSPSQKQSQSRKIILAKTPLERQEKILLANCMDEMKKIKYRQGEESADTTSLPFFDPQTPAVQSAIGFYSTVLDKHFNTLLNKINVSLACFDRSKIDVNESSLGQNT